MIGITFNYSAAVAGDEVALDTLTSWRPRTTARNISQSSVKDNQCLYVGTQTGIVYYINQSGTCTEVLKNDNNAIIQILWHPKRFVFAKIKFHATFSCNIF